MEKNDLNLSSKSYFSMANITKTLSYLILIDILFFPYFNYFIIPISLPIVLFLIFHIRKIKGDIYFQLFIIISIGVFASNFSFIFFNIGDSYLIENFKRAFQIVLTFPYFFYFRWAASKFNLNFKKILLTFIIYQLLLGILFFINPNILILLKEKIYLQSSHIANRVISNKRFSYLFVDPNTAAYFYLISLFFLISNYKNKSITKIFVLLSSLILLLLFQSNGAILTTVLVIFFIIIKRIFIIQLINKKKFFITFFTFVSIIIFITLFHPIQEIFIKLISQYGSRFEWNYLINNPRIQIYLKGIKNLKPGFLGRGYVLLINNNFYKPHSDHIRMIYSYGIISYISIITFLFKNIIYTRFEFLFPAFMAFSINTLIDEQKLLALVMIFIGVTLSNERYNYD